MTGRKKAGAPPKAYHTTKVEANRTKGEIRDLLLRYGATQFGIMEEEGRALVVFHAQGRTVRIEVPLPASEGPPAKNEEMRIWRATRAWIYAQLAAVESGIKTLEEVFLADTLLANGHTVGQWYGSQLTELARTGALPALPGLEQRIARLP